MSGDTQQGARESGAGAAAAARFRLRPGLLVGLLLLGLVLYFVGRELFARFGAVSWTQIEIHPLPLVLAFVCLGLHRAVHAAEYEVLLTSLGRGVGYLTAVAVTRTAALGRYVPGKLISASSVVFLLTRFGVRLSTALTAVFVATALTVWIGLLVSAPLLFLESVRNLVPVRWLWCAAVVVGGCVCLHPRVFVALSNWLLRRLGREPIGTVPPGRQFALLILLILVRFSLLGVGVWLAARSFTSVGLGQYPLLTASAVFAAVVGFLAFFAPGGIGVREGLYLVILGPVLGPGSAALLAVLVRLIDLLADVATGAAGILILRWRLAGARRGSRPVEAAGAQVGRASAEPLRGTGSPL